MGDDDYGEDDFEDYEDEFEADETEQAVSGIQQALQEEDDAVRERLKQAGVKQAGPVVHNFASATAAPPPAALAAPKKHLIAPPTNSSRELSAQKTARLEALRKVLQLRSVDMLLYDAPPLTAYELHTRHQSRHLRAKSTQTRDDDTAVAVQTEPVEAEEQECQVPEDLGTAGRNTALTKSEGAQTASLLSANVARLNRFLRSAGQLMEALCAENVRSAVGGFSSAHSLMNVSMRAATMRLPETLGARALVDVSFAAEGDALLAAYGGEGEAAEGKAKSKKEVRRLLPGGLLCVWRLQQTEAPWQLLRCIGLPSCCLCLRRSYLAACGTHEGGVQLWDLREPAAQHPCVEGHGALRSPTFCSDAAMGNHSSPIVALTELPAAAGEEEVSVASLEQHGTVVVWLLIETRDNEADATDYGQAVGGRVRLFRSGHVPLTGGGYDANATGDESPRASPRKRGGGDSALLPLRTLCLGFCPGEVSRFVVGGDTGQMLQGSRHAGPSASKPTPRVFEPEGAAPLGAGACMVHSLAFCPVPGLHAYMAAARSDGSLSLYQIDDPRPLRTWQGFTTAALLQVQWSPVRPCVLWTIDADATLHVFDLLDDESEPVVSTPLRKNAPRRPPPLGRSDGAAARLRLAVGTRPQARESEAPSMLALTCSLAGDESSLDVHLVSERLSQPAEGEAEQLQRFLEAL